MTIKKLAHLFQTTAVTAALVFSVTASGCIYLVVGGIGALGGYVISPDTVEGIVHADEKELWDKANNVLAIMGSIDEVNEEGGVILANVAGAKVSVVMLPYDEDSMKIRVKARKAFLPKISTAQDVYVKIMSEVSEKH